MWMARRLFARFVVVPRDTLHDAFCPYADRPARSCRDWDYLAADIRKPAECVLDLLRRRSSAQAACSRTTGAEC